MVNVLSSSDPEVGAVLTTSPDVDVVTFTGSTATGRRIMAAASDTLKRVFLELGGKSAAIVLDDADFSMAALFAAFSMASHAGQGCALASRLLVPKKHHDEIVNLVAQNFSLVRHGDPADEKMYMGPLISEQQRDKVDGMVQRAVEAGATLVTGGQRLDPGYFYAPTLLTNVDPDSEIAQEEIFGPVLVVIGYDDDDDAVRIANNSIYGLSGAVFGGQDRALAVARRSEPAPSASTAATTSAPTHRSADTSRAASAGRWERQGWRSSWKRRRSRRSMSRLREEEKTVDEPLARRAKDIDEPLARRAEDSDEPLARRAEDSDEPLARRAEDSVQ